MYRNMAQIWTVFAFDETTGIEKTGDTLITAKISKDGGIADSLTAANLTELEAGYYTLDISAAESDAQHLSIIPISTTNNIQVVGSPASITTFEHVIAGICTGTGDAATVNTTLQTTHSLTTTGALIGRVLIFDAETVTTPALSQQAGVITGYSSGGVITFAAGTFTTGHGASDTFKIY